MIDTNDSENNNEDEEIEYMSEAESESRGMRTEKKVKRDVKKYESDE